MIFLGGGLGSLSRFGVGAMAHKFYKGGFPIGTLIVNTVACLILGLMVYYFRERIEQNDWIKYLIVIGFCGGFSTFSTFSLDTVKLMQDQLYMFAILNILISLALGIGILIVLTK